MYHKPLFTIFGQSVWAYGLCMAVGIVACFAFLYIVMARRNFNDEAISKILGIGIFATAFGIFMAMVFQSVYNFIEDPSSGFELDTSMTFQGGLIGGVSSFVIVWNVYVFAIAPHAKKVRFLSNNMNAGLTDALPIIPIGIVIAHAFGRLGCFFGGCCYGKPTDAWYGVACAYGWNSDLKMNMEGVNVIPTQLFECSFLFVLAAIMCVLFFKYKFNCNFGLYAIAYGIWRFLIEYARVDHRGELVGGITPSQFWSIVMVVLGIAYFFVYKYLFKRLMKHPELQPSCRADEATPAQAAA
jgi:phosphatidylglycerol:prolipoprotein diacylglycerol transferase